MIVKTKLLTLQEVRTTNCRNGNPRKLVMCYLLKIDDRGTLHINTISVNIGDRIATQAVNEEFGVYTTKDYDNIAWLETMNVSVDEYNRLLKI